MTPDLTLCVHVYSLFGLCAVICQVVGDRTSTLMLHLLCVSHETDDLLVLVADYCVQQTVSHDSLAYMTLYAVAKYPMPHSKDLTCV